MKVTNISIEAKRSNGNYGSDSVRIDAEIGENEDSSKAIDSLRIYADWKLSAEGHAKQAQAHRERSQHPEATPEQKAASEKWLAAYTEWMGRVADAYTAVTFGSTEPESEEDAYATQAEGYANEEWSQS